MIQRVIVVSFVLFFTVFSLCFSAGTTRKSKGGKTQIIFVPVFQETNKKDVSFVEKSVSTFTFTISNDGDARQFNTARLSKNEIQYLSLWYKKELKKEWMQDIEINKWEKTATWNKIGLARPKSYKPKRLPSEIMKLIGNYEQKK